MMSAAGVKNLLTRREVVGAVTLSIAGLGSGRALAWQKKEEAPTGGAEDSLTYLHQEVDFKATAQRIYEALLDAKQFAAFTGMPAQISREAGGAFSTFGGLIEGRNVELLDNQRIVQAWRPKSWDPGIYSMVKFEFKQEGSRATVILDHTGFPRGNFSHLNSGWYQRYWDPLRKYLG